MFPSLGLHGCPFVLRLTGEGDLVVLGADELASYGDQEMTAPHRIDDIF